MPLPPDNVDVKLPPLEHVTEPFVIDRAMGGGGGGGGTLIQAVQSA